MTTSSADIMSKPVYLQYIICVFGIFSTFRSKYIGGKIEIKRMENRIEA